MGMTAHKEKMARKKTARATMTAGFTAVPNSARDARKQRMQKQKLAMRQIMREQK